MSGGGRRGNILYPHLNSAIELSAACPQVNALLVAHERCVESEDALLYLPAQAPIATLPDEPAHAARARRGALEDYPNLRLAIEQAARAIGAVRRGAGARKGRASARGEAMQRVHESATRHHQALGVMRATQKRTLAREARA